MHKRRIIKGALIVWGLLLLVGCVTPDPQKPPPANATNSVIERIPIEYAPQRRLP